MTLSAGRETTGCFFKKYMLENPGVLVLDEGTTASIDTKTRRTTSKCTYLKFSPRQITTIVIAHRLSTIIDADKILHLMDGKIIEEGTHEELLQKNHYMQKCIILETGKS